MPPKPIAREMIVPMSGTLPESFRHRPRPWHVPVVEVHLTGVCRVSGMGYERYAKAGTFEHAARKQNLVFDLYLN